MGFNHRYAGYESVEEMFTAFRDSANAQIIGFFDFIRAEPIRKPVVMGNGLISIASPPPTTAQAVRSTIAT